MRVIKHYLLVLIALLNLPVAVTGAHATIVWHNPLAEKYQTVCGRAWNSENSDNYHRLPDRVRPLVRSYLWDVATQSAGLSVAFRTTSPVIEVSYTVTDEIGRWGMAATGASGVDLYAMDVNGRMRWCAANISFGDTVRFSYRDINYTGDPLQGYEFRLYLPLNNTVQGLMIGTEEGSPFSFIPTATERPIVVYGTSIAQGACVSRPGMSWTNIVERESGHPVVNLGLAGQGQLDPQLFSLLSEIDASLYVVDCMPNMNGQLTAEIFSRTVDGVKSLRRAHADTPILLVEHSGYVNDGTSAVAERSYRSSNAELLRAYRQLEADGVQGLYYLTHDEIGLQMDDMVEGIHPNEMGMRRYADAYLKKIRRIMGEEQTTVFVPCRQQRDSYNWLERHEEAIRLNLKEQPDIVLIGNSITHYWAGTPKARDARGTDSWQKLFRGHTVRNMGFGWDRIENALWRIYHGELDGFKAKKVFLLMGTNNLDRNDDDEIVDGILALVKAVRSRQPEARIYVCGILPRAWAETHVRMVNDLLQRRLIGSDATYVDMSPEVTGADGRVINELFIDGLHPNAEGYERMAKMMEWAVKE
jgi:lysophospholipase L1-like esterase